MHPIIPAVIGSFYVPIITFLFGRYILPSSSPLRSISDLPGVPYGRNVRALAQQIILIYIELTTSSSSGGSTTLWRELDQRWGTSSSNGPDSGACIGPGYLLLRATRSPSMSPPEPFVGLGGPLALPLSLHDVGSLWLLPMIMTLFFTGYCINRMIRSHQTASAPRIAHQSAHAFRPPGFVDRRNNMHTGFTRRVFQDRGPAGGFSVTGARNSFGSETSMAQSSMASPSFNAGAVPANLQADVAHITGVEEGLAGNNEIVVERFEASFHGAGVSVIPSTTLETRAPPNDLAAAAPETSTESNPWAGEYECPSNSGSHDTQHSFDGENLLPEAGPSTGPKSFKDLD